MNYLSKIKKSIIWSVLISIIFLSLFPAVLVQAQTNKAKVQDFVKRLYTVALRREAEQAGLDYWTQRLIDQKIDAAKTVHFILLDSPEFLNKNYADMEFIETSYMTFFNRPSDSGGLKFWLGKLNQGYTRRWVIANMLAAPTAEFDNLCKTAGIITGKISTVAVDLPNKNGNTPGNINGMGFVASQGDWIFYSYLAKDEVKNEENYGHLYKVRKNGRDLTKLTEYSVKYINVVGEWIYYINTDNGHKIMKMKTDGSEETVLSNEPATHLSVNGDYLYYLTLDDTLLYQMKKDGTQNECLASSSTKYYHVSGDRIYYSNSTYNYISWGYTMPPYSPGPGRGGVNNDKALFINIVGDWIYYINASDGNRPYKVRNGNLGRTKLGNIQSASDLHVVGDWVYFKTTTGLYKVKTDGSRGQEILNFSASKIKINSFNIVDDKIFLIEMGGKWPDYYDSNLSMMKINGTEITRIYPY